VPKLSKTSSFVDDNDLLTANNKLFKGCKKYERVSRLSLKKLNEVECEKEALIVYLLYY
jgi:hypothetical protein